MAGGALPTTSSLNSQALAPLAAPLFGGVLAVSLSGPDSTNGGSVTPPKSPEEILADYTEDLMAERPPRLTADVALLDEASRREVLRLAALVRAVKAAKAEEPNPSAEFLARLDARVTAEVAQLSAGDVGAPGRPAATAPGEQAKPSPPHPLHPWREVLLGFFTAWRWQLVGCAVAGILLLQGHLILKVKGLQEENRNLLLRVERLATPDRMVPLALPTEIGLRLRIDQRIEELEKERASKTGEERRAVERAMQELRVLLEPARNR